MCGIVAAAARREVSEILLEGLRRLEYRGYDSAGIATVSVGVALAPEHALGGERAFLRHADQALYAAKESGRNCTVVYGS